MPNTTKTTTITKPVDSAVLEMRAIRRVQNAFIGLTPAARARVVNFVWSQIQEKIDSERTIHTDRSQVARVGTPFPN